MMPEYGVTDETIAEEAKSYVLLQRDQHFEVRCIIFDSWQAGAQ